MSFTPPEPVPSDPTPPPAPAAPAPAPVPQYGQYAPPTGYAATPQQQYYAPSQPANRKGLGVVAFVAGLVVLVVSPILSGVFGSVYGQATAPASNFSEGFTQGQAIAQSDPAIVTTTAFIILQVVLGTGIGVWALVQGIVATRLGRGRVFGILAIVFAALAPLISFLVFVVVAGAVSAATH